MQNYHLLFVKKTMGWFKGFYSVITTVQFSNKRTFFYDKSNFSTTNPKYDKTNFNCFANARMQACKVFSVYLRAINYELIHGQRLTLLLQLMRKTLVTSWVAQTRILVLLSSALKKPSKLKLMNLLKTTTLFMF